MRKRGIRAIYSMLGVAGLWLVPAVANAQVTVTSVKVTVSGTKATAVYCDSTLACGASGGIVVWTLPAGGQLVPAGKTMVLTQTALIPGVGGNFDTSDRVRPAPASLAACNAADPCTVTVQINGQTPFSSALAEPLNFGNADDGTSVTNEAHDWVLAATKPNYTLKFGYADNVHSAPCPGSGCFPVPFSSANFFFGAGGAAEGSCASGCYDAGALLITGVLAPPTLTGRMTGGGSIFEADGTRVTHGFEIHCDITDVPNTLEVNWPDANNFHMDTLTSAVCTDDPNIHQQPPKSAPFDTFVGTGTGKLNGVDGATISFTFVDAGEPGTSDTAKYIIKDHLGNVVLNVPATFLTKGNQQTHTDNN
jgi:hypothetical protein